jgi:pre-mRNA-splicing helicase BRR2
MLKTNTVTLTVPMLELVLPNYYIFISSDCWLHSETCHSIPLKHLILQTSSSTPLLDLQTLPLLALHTQFEDTSLSAIRMFNKIQTQVFHTLYTLDENVLIGAPTRSGKTIRAEFALLQLWSRREQHKVICINPRQEVVYAQMKEW